MSPRPPARHVVLASRSPRRLELLQTLGVSPDVQPADIDETPATGEKPVAYVRRLAEEKARAVSGRIVSVAGHRGTVILAADTTVDVDGRILGQPADEAEARAMLRALSGRSHRVHTGVAVIDAEGRLASTVVSSVVTMVALTDHLLDWYVSTGEPFGKAGAYAVQGAGGVLVERVRGSQSNVVGLPLRETADLLGRAGVPVRGTGHNAGHGAGQGTGQNTG